MSINNDKNIFSTSDLALAAAISLYYPIQSINKSRNSKRVFFIFLKDKNFDLYIERFYRGELRIDPQKYFQNLKSLKNRIYNG